jgi:hypothetical protein
MSHYTICQDVIVYFPQQTTDPEIVPGLFKLLGERSGTLQVFFSFKFFGA